MSRKKILITGAASGIGRAVAERFAAEGADVCLNDLNDDKLKLVFDALPAGNHLQLAGSYADPQTMAAGENLIRQHWNRIDVLVSCAGISEATDPLAMTPERWRQIFDTMVNGCLLITRLAATFMPDGGRIIHISSIHANHAEKGASSYSMAKAAISQFCRAMAVELAPRNILVNAIAPGFVNTAMSMVDGKSELESDWFRQNYIDGHHLPLRRAAAPEEIAGVAFFLAGKDAGYITGQVLTVDGGLTITF